MCILSINHQIRLDCDVVTEGYKFFSENTTQFCIHPPLSLLKNQGKGDIVQEVNVTHYYYFFIMLLFIILSWSIKKVNLKIKCCQFWFQNSFSLGVISLSLAKKTEMIILKYHLSAHQSSLYYSLNIFSFYVYGAKNTLKNLGNKTKNAF